MRHMRWIAPVVALAMFGWVMGSVVKAADAPAAATGTIQGKVVDKDGKAVAGAKVKVMAEGKHHAKHEEGEKKEKSAAVAEAQTDAQGDFTVSVPAGEYVVMAMAKKVGMAHEKVTVTAGQTATVSLKLAEHKKK